MGLKVLQTSSGAPRLCRLDISSKRRSRKDPYQKKQIYCWPIHDTLPELMAKAFAVQFCVVESLYALGLQFIGYIYAISASDSSLLSQAKAMHLGCSYPDRINMQDCFLLDASVPAFILYYTLEVRLAGHHAQPRSLGSRRFCSSESLGQVRPKASAV
ncbi:uncharacterized protein PGTG_18573 [Puccinia graminis f. sp. tritici CRL 75-36-700-3]|uniref:Uncharacterized protein n=1 Tax=Puccinia graminis f. sp. tritici (strain CRL 75-36-700-3 / race SCCL) TaxID=418459 RepID=E3L8B9_PUCGT|nr:uncharacterized protein PGTG_18573 [Puccinia graminis f. sp. tritici CRL 75-36-700-3]EFP92794.1 hypothetical protein PGTG_18573 [Puccinia graminis f. sp. tritici CRL 75-36-700-3]